MHELKKVVDACRSERCMAVVDCRESTEEGISCQAKDLYAGEACGLCILI